MQKAMATITFPVDVDVGIIISLLFIGSLLLLLLLLLVLLLLLLSTIVLYAIFKHRHNCYVDINYLQKRIKVDRGALFSFFQPHLISMEEISARGHSSLLSLTQHMIGIQPICDSVLTLWPPSFDCYNILLPNSLNFPEVLVLGGVVPGSVVDIKLISLAMYASSRANECAYCTSHCCSFAMRRGVDPTILRNLLTEVSKTRSSNDDGSTSTSLSPKE